MKREKLIVCVTDFINSHGKTPRGRGSWAFYFNSDDDIWWSKDEIGCSSMTYSEALKLAKKEARRRNATVITVAP